MEKNILKIVLRVYSIRAIKIGKLFFGIIYQMIVVKKFLKNIKIKG